MPDVKTLLPLQDIDRHLYHLRKERARKPQELAGLRRAVADAQAACEEKERAVKDLKIEASKLDLEMKSMDERIKKLDADSLKAKKNSDFLAIKKAIGGIQADQSMIAEKWLELEARIEVATRAWKEAETEWKAAQARLAAEEARIRGEIDMLDKAIAEMEAKRGEARAGLDMEMLGVYERIIRSEGKEGQALAKVLRHPLALQPPRKGRKAKGDGEEPEAEPEFSSFSYSCSGCNSQLNLQDVNLLILGREVRICRNCSRILYYQESASAQ